MLNVFLTVDTEVWPFASNWPAQPLPATKHGFEREIAAYIHGTTSAGDFGIPFQVRVLKDHGLCANYFTEALAPDRIGAAALADIIRLIDPSTNDVQLHLHTEWLGDTRTAGLPQHYRQHLRHFSEDEQVAIIGLGIKNLIAAGAPRPNTMRAGNYGANLATLRAARRCGLQFDTSHNTCYLDSACDMPLRTPVLQPRMVEGIYEFPVSYFEDFPGHYRHAQLCACSFRELAQALIDAERAGWYAFVIVLHSFELVKIAAAQSTRLRPDRLNVRRFVQLCEFLSDRRHDFRTRRFSEVSPEEIPFVDRSQSLRTRSWHTAARFAEQAWAKLA